MLVDTGGSAASLAAERVILSEEEVAEAPVETVDTVEVDGGEMVEKSSRGSW